MVKHFFSIIRSRTLVTLPKKQPSQRQAEARSWFDTLRDPQHGGIKKETSHASSAVSQVSQSSQSSQVSQVSQTPFSRGSPVTRTVREPENWAKHYRSLSTKRKKYPSTDPVVIALEKLADKHQYIKIHQFFQQQKNLETALANPEAVQLYMLAEFNLHNYEKVQELFARYIKHGYLYSPYVRMGIVAMLETGSLTLLKRFFIEMCHDPRTYKCDHFILETVARGLSRKGSFELLNFAVDYWTQHVGQPQASVRSIVYRAHLVRGVAYENKFTSSSYGKMTKLLYDVYHGGAGWQEIINYRNGLKAKNFPRDQLYLGLLKTFVELDDEKSVSKVSELIVKDRGHLTEREKLVVASHYMKTGQLGLLLGYITMNRLVVGTLLIGFLWQGALQNYPYLKREINNEFRLACRQLEGDYRASSLLKQLPALVEQEHAVQDISPEQQIKELIRGGQRPKFAEFNRVMKESPVPMVDDVLESLGYHRPLKFDIRWLEKSLPPASSLQADDLRKTMVAEFVEKHKQQLNFQNWIDLCSLQLRIFDYTGARTALAWAQGLVGSSAERGVYYRMALRTHTVNLDGEAVLETMSEMLDSKTLVMPHTISQLKQYYEYLNTRNVLDEDAQHDFGVLLSDLRSKYVMEKFEGISQIQSSCELIVNELNKK